MSCWREQVVLRLPVQAAGITTREEMNAFEGAHEEDFCWEPGHFAPALCGTSRGIYLDYILRDRAPVRAGGSDVCVRALRRVEREAYLPVFRTLFPDFTLAGMEQVHYCRFRWYDGGDAPHCY